MNAKSSVLVMLAASSLFAVGSQAQATRTWVSGVGDDVNPCSRTAPCKTFTGAIAKTAVGGEINALDPASFGIVTITKSITLGAEYTEGGVQNPLASGVTINAPGIHVVLRGLDIEGGLNGVNGINVVQAGTVVIEKCVINGQGTGFGINVVPSAGSVNVLVKDTYIHNNFTSTSGGIFAQGSASTPVTLTLDNVRLEHNFFGLKVQDFVKANVRNSTATGNVNNGFWAFSAAGGAAELNLEGSTATLNGVTGVRSENSGALVRISNMQVTDNATVGLQISAAATMVSWVNNHVAGNGTNISGTLSTVLPN